MVTRIPARPHLPQEVYDKIAQECWSSNKPTRTIAKYVKELVAAELIEVQAGYGNVYQFVVMSYHQSHQIAEYETNATQREYQIQQAALYMAGGDVEWVFGEMTSDEASASEKDLMGNGYLAFNNGVRGYLRSMFCGASSWEVDIIGTAGRIRSLNNAEEFELIRTIPGGRRGGGVPAKSPFPWSVRMERMGLTIVADIIDAIETGQPPKCTGEDGRHALEVAIALRESHRRGGIKVNLPLQDRKLRILASESLHDEVPARIRRQQASSSN